MQYKIKDIGLQGLDIQVPVTAPWAAAELSEAGVKPGPAGLTLRGRLEHSGQDYLLRGTLKGEVETSCVRCLEPALLPVDVDIAVCFVEKEKETEESDDLDAPDVIPFEDGVIDLSSEIRDEILLALPQNPACKESCAGLCPVCGGNRNVKPCDCEAQQKVAQSKFAALGKLKI